MHVIACEDEIIYQNSLQEKINLWAQKTHHADIKVTFFRSSEDLLEHWGKGLKADLLFLDIIFHHEMNGMEIAKKIRETDDVVPIVFVTNSDAFIKDGYAVRAFRYLNKPILYEDVALCLDVAYKQYTLAHNEYLIIADAGRRLALRHNEVLYVEAQSPYTLIHMQGHAEPIKLRYRFLDLIPKLPEELFILCHRSYLVNIIHVRAVKRHTLTLSTGEELPVSRSLGAHLNDSFDNYYQEGGISHGVDCI
ncbi:MAG: LytR/AlgR family response regulator transcription factor [Faecousia sp.]